ncbi:MAG TPA: hypothetical protein VMH85_15060 [Terriglobales bacterium]|nr:hypothetical protein [Terriglobales bacterium]
MSWRKRIPLWIVPAAAILAVAAAVLLLRFANRQPVVLKGAITVQDKDPRKQLPVADVQVTELGGLAEGPAKSDASGYFSLKLRPQVRRGDAITLQFRHPEYEPLDLHDYAGDKLYIVELKLLAQQKPPDPNQPTVRVSNVRVRYTIKALTAANIGSAVKTFEIENKGNVPCKGQHPCSPDGKWKAAVDSASLDAGVGNEFRNARASCIAGPCPFTRIDSDQFSQGGRTISVSARAWSDTATFLLEAEVFHPMVSEILHESYPVIFGETLNFTAPSGAEGVSIEADINGETIIFPLGPNLFLSWATCRGRLDPDQTTVYNCELKQGFQFR